MLIALALERDMRKAEREVLREMRQRGPKERHRKDRKAMYWARLAFLAWRNPHRWPTKWSSRPKTYRDKTTKEEKREADRKRVAEKRAESRVSQSVAECSDLSPEVADVHTQTHTIRARAARAQIEQEEPKPTAAAAVTTELLRIGIKASPTHPKLLKLVDAGVTKDEIIDAAREALGRKKGTLDYVLAMVEGRRRDAAEGVVPEPQAAKRPEYYRARGPRAGLQMTKDIVDAFARTLRVSNP